jgi:hypothetical protein
LSADDTGNGQKLPLVERARRGLPDTFLQERGKAEFAYWLDVNQWTRRETAFLLLGKCPLFYEGKEAPPGVKNLLRVLERYPFPDMVRPLDMARWFVEKYGKFYPLPPELAALVTAKAESLPPAEPSFPEKTAALPAVSPAPAEPIAKSTTRWRESDLTPIQIRDLRLSGLSVDHIADVLKVPRHRITKANQRFKIDSLPRGTKPKIRD